MPDPIPGQTPDEGIRANESGEKEVERTIEVPVTVIVKVPESMVFGNEHGNKMGLVRSGTFGETPIAELIRKSIDQSSLTGRVYTEIKTQFPEAVADDKRFEENIDELLRMIKVDHFPDRNPPRPTESSATETLDLDRARQLLIENRELSSRYHFADNEYTEKYIIERFAGAGQSLDVENPEE